MGNVCSSPPPREKRPRKERKAKRRKAADRTTTATIHVTPQQQRKAVSVSPLLPNPLVHHSKKANAVVVSYSPDPKATPLQKSSRVVTSSESTTGDPEVSPIPLSASPNSTIGQTQQLIERVWPTSPPAVAQAGPPAPPPVRRVSRDELRRHCRLADAWIAVRSDVYDISALIMAHPGGSAVLLALAGQDATSAFERQHGEGNSDAFTALRRHRVGALE